MTSSLTNYDNKAYFGKYDEMFDGLKKLKEELVSAAYFLCPDKICYYGSSVSRRDLFDKPLSHAIIWEAILESKKKGAYLLNIGSTYEFKFNKFG